MARPTEFTRAHVLDMAMRTFLEHGYAGTSIVDLLTATGLSKSSLYASFGGKRELFIAAYDAYRVRRSAHLTSVLDAHQAPRGIRAFFEEIIDTGEEELDRFGCMSTNLAIELSRADPDIRSRVTEDQQQMGAAFLRHLEAGYASGAVNPAVDAARLADALVTVFSGFQVTIRAGVDRRRLASTLEWLLAPLDVPKSGGATTTAP